MKVSKKFYKTTLPSDMIFTKEDVSTSDEQVLSYKTFFLPAHWFMSIIISQLKYHSISVDQARYATSIVAK